jgi:hypothetical protein
MQHKVEQGRYRGAVRKLFCDPRFNIPDPFEAYSGDWTGGEPISAELLATLNQARSVLFTEKEKAEEKPPQPEEKPKEDEPRRQDA